MNSQVAIRRSRGAVSGAALMLLGLWGGLAPFIGPYLHFGYTPDTAWAYTTGRLYYSVLPGAAALAGGLLVVTTRSRVIGVTGGVLAALGGLWFVVGAGVMSYLLKQTSIGLGLPIGYGAAGTQVTAGSTYTAKEYLEVLALYTALGAVIIFVGAVAAGRLSLISFKDAEADGYYSEYSASSGTSDSSGYTTGQFPATTQYPDSPPAGEFPTAAGQFPSATGQFTRPSTFPPRSGPFDDAPRPLSPDEPAQ
jgi:hypothetical protein